MENKVRGISDVIGRLTLAGESSRFLVVGQTEADAEHRALPHQSKFRGHECRREHFVTANPVPAE